MSDKIRLHLIWPLFVLVKGDVVLALLTDVKTESGERTIKQEKNSHDIKLKTFMYSR